jgi:hypothetical protein
MLQTYVYGFPQPAATNSIPVRLGYWRFDSPLLYAEQGQMPLSSSNVTTVPSWSGTALSICSSASSQVTYPDVGSNGWANFNCRQGSVRFWFKPNSSSGLGSGGAPFFYVGSPYDSTNMDEWALVLNSTATSIYFNSGSNTVIPTLLSASCSLTNTNQWTQVVLTYGLTNSSLYLNGLPVVTDGSGVTAWPRLSTRQLGLVIGNNTGYNSPINGQFEEMETFNYQLSPGEILSNFQIVSNVDSDLDGVPDYLEDIKLTKNRPFLGAPVVITGTIEAEQFDMGGPGIAYSNSSNHAASSYRPTGMFITNCTDLAGGYCLIQTQSNDWALYTIYVPVAQTYMVDARVAGLGITGGVFRIEFTNTNGFSTNTASLTIASTTNWIDVTNVVFLTNGVYAMKLHCLANAPGTNYVGQFNYISIYPWWPPPIIPAYTNIVTGLSTVSNYATALSNATNIQNAINIVGSMGGGTVFITNTGIFYVAQASPNETNSAYANSAVYLTNSNIQISGAGETNTALIGFNRATTIFALGVDQHNNLAQCINFSLCNILLEARPDWAVSNIASTNISNDANQFVMSAPNDQNTNLVNGFETGALGIFWGPISNANFYTYNILLSNCTFVNGYDQLTIWNTHVSNVLVTACNFLWNSNAFYGNVGLFSQAINVVMLSNTFNGNTNLVLTNYEMVSTNSYYGGYIASVGLAWLQYGQNFFLSGNTILNNVFEGVQINEGPASVVGNTFSNCCNSLSSCALCATGYNGNSNWNSVCFVGNSVYGGRLGQRGENTTQTTNLNILNFSGNTLNLYPAYNTISDYPGAAVLVENCRTANVCGNTMLNGGYGFRFEGTNNIGALLLNNNFGSASYCGVGYTYTGEWLNGAQIFGNILGQGVNFHIQLTYTNSFAWFAAGEATFFL